ncbi:MAG: GDSL-type esterase/lipase family protein [Pseudomonadota bacterium]
MSWRRRALLGSLPLWLGAAAPLPTSEQLRLFASADEVAPSPPGTVLFVGSSTIRLWPRLADDFAPLAVVQRGFGGATLAEVVTHADVLFAPHRPAAIVLYAGENDIAAGASPADVAERFSDLLDRLAVLYPEPVPIIVPGPKPSLARAELWPAMQATTVALSDVASPVHDVQVIDLAPRLVGPEGRLQPSLYAPDLLHFSEAGYRVLRAIVAEALVDAGAIGESGRDGPQPGSAGGTFEPVAAVTPAP